MEENVHHFSHVEMDTNTYNLGKPKLQSPVKGLKIKLSKTESHFCLIKLTVSQTSPDFYVSAAQVFKTLREQEKLCFLPF